VIERPPAVHELEAMLSDHLDTRVTIELSARKSRVIVEFADLDDLERIYRRLTSPEE
jgi:ParB family chromosome partitioning protein